MTEIARIPAPKGLSLRGRRLWKQVVTAYVMRPDELTVLETACKTLDIVVDLEAAMAGQPLTVKGSMGQERENPLLAEARQQRALLNRSLAQLKLPDLPTAKGGAKPNQHRAAAQSRWAQTHGGAS
jgi:phage terminase small subunit